MRAKRNLMLLSALMILGGIIVFSSGCGDDDPAESGSSWRDVVEGECTLTDDAAACVDETIITKDDVAARIESLRRVYGAMVPAEDADGDGVLDEAFTNLRREVANKLVNEELRLKEEERRGISVTEEEIDILLFAFADESYLGDYDAMVSDYEEKGVSIDELREDARRDIGFQKLEEDIRKDIEVTDEDALDYYMEHEAQYVQPDRLTTRQLITDDEATAQAAVTRALAGESMVDLVVELSVDPEKQDKKGSLGLVSPGQLAPELDAVLVNMEMGDISEPIQVGSKWYVLTVEGTVPGYNYSFEEKKEEIKFLYGNQQYAEKFKEINESLLSNTTLNYDIDYDPDLIVDLGQSDEGEEQDTVTATGDEAVAAPETPLPVEVP
jgi:parvulin-like peptidyl-prolyl isomerase